MPSCDEFIAELEKLADPAAIAEVARFFHYDTDPTTQILGVRIGKVFPVARRFTGLDLNEIERALESKYYEVRMGAVSIMDFQARAKKVTPAQRKALFDLYLRRHDRINNWDMVDRAAPHVVGGYLADQPREVLYGLARSRSPWERRTAIVSTYFFLRMGDVEDTFAIAELLVRDEHELVQKAVGSWIREAGKKDSERLLQFLDRHAPSMPRTMLRYAVEKLPAVTRNRYLGR